MTEVGDGAMRALPRRGAFRRSELAALDLGDLSLANAGLVITIRRSKTDQEGAGRQVAAREAVFAWLRELK